MFWKAVEKTINKMNMVGAVCLAGMTLLTCADVVGRFFRHPIFGSVELVGYMAILAVAMAMPHIDRNKGHVAVEIIVRLLPEKVQCIFELCTRLFSTALFAIIAWRTVLYASTMQKSGEVSMNLEFPEYIIIYTVGFCFILLTLTALQDIIKAVIELRNK